MRRAFILGGAILILAVIGTGSYVFWNGQGRPQYRTARAERSDIVSTISATGTLNAVITVQVGSQISGMIKELRADFNSEVKKHQLIARIDPATFEAKLAQAKADLDNARAAVLNAQAAVARGEADVANARANVVRAEVQVRDARVKRKARDQLFQEGGISQEERDTAQATEEAAAASLEAARASQRSALAALMVARAQLEAAKAQVAQKQGAVDQAQVDLDNTYIRAPVDGTVVSRNVDVGQTVAASLQAPTLFLIAQDLTKMQVETNVDEADISRVVLDQAVTFTVDSFPGQLFRGRVVQIRQAPQIVQNVVTYVVVVAVDNPGLRLKPGMTANVRILVARKDNVVVVPNAAFRVRLDPPGADGVGRDQAKRPGGDAAPGKRPGEGGPQGVGRGGGAGPGAPGAGGLQGAGPAMGRQRVAAAQRLWVVKEGKPEPRTVRTGLSDGQRTEIEEGVADGDEVIVAVSRPGAPEAPAKRPGPPGSRIF
jgi:HlyD family secretion protein